jgi:hypothetical protein
MNALPFALPRRSNHSGSTSYVRIIALSEFANAARIDHQPRRPNRKIPAAITTRKTHP